MKKVAFMGTDGGVSFSGLGFDQALLKIGQNTGNALFHYALWRKIGNPRFSITPHIAPDQVRANADIIVIPAANQVNPAWDLDGWADFIEACDLPVVCIGLGAQASIDENPRLKLKPGTERYIKAVAARSHSIGVRGAFTQEVLAHLGVENTVITGCPSQTINPNIKGRVIQSRIEEYCATEVAEVAYVLGTLEEGARHTDQILAQMVRERDHAIILQTDPRLLSLLHNRVLEETDRPYVAWIGKIIRPDLTEQAFMEYLLRRGRFYSDARSWIDHMRRYDLVLGMRIHGTVAAIQAETLGICVTFDSRTKELAHTMGYPYIASDEIRPERSFQDIVARTVFSPQRFDHLRKLHTDRIDQMLTNAGCEVIAAAF